MATFAERDWRNDDYMTYNKKVHRYILEPKGVSDLLGIDLNLIFRPSTNINPSGAIRGFLNQVSLICYNEIYKKVMNREYFEFLLANHPPLRERMQEIMLDTVDYMKRNGNLSAQSGINLEKGTYIDRVVIEKALVSCQAKILLEDTIPGFGFSLSYRGSNLPSQAYSLNYCELKSQGVY